MARTRPAHRFEQLIASATEVFIASGGFQRTQIGDIARAMGVAKGTVYLYVESKEALFDEVLRCADQPVVEPTELPLPTPGPGQMLARVSARIRQDGRFPLLEQALEHDAPDDASDELEEILGEVYDLLAANRTAIKLIGVSAHDLPELAAAWFGDGRAALNRRLAEYLRRRADARALAPVAAPAVSARLVSETLTWFAVHRHWDPAPEPMDDAEARETAIGTLVAGLMRRGDV